MNYWLAVILASLCVIALGRCAAAECFGSPREVLREHPKTHPTWHYVDGKQCWRAVPSRARQDRRGSYGMAAPVPTVPLPRRRPDPELTHPQLYARLTAYEGRALSIYLLGE